jgi:hypothetical protein
MRAFAGIVAIVSSTAAPARAEHTVEVLGGVTAPLGDRTWTGIASVGGKLGARYVHAVVARSWFTFALAAGGDVAFLGVPSQPAPTTLPNPPPPGDPVVSRTQLRTIVSAVGLARVASRLALGARVGVGADFEGESRSAARFPSFDVGFAFEIAIGAWYQLRPAYQLGVEISAPHGFHAQNDAVGCSNYCEPRFVNVDPDVRVSFRRSW